MRRKQIGPELKLFELDTLKYITPENIKDSIYYIGIYPDRMSAADITFARKSGLLDTSSGKMNLSSIALHYILNAITFREYAFLILSKQWIKTINIGNIPPIYNEPLLTYILREIQTYGHISKSSFTQEMDMSLASKYAPIPLSNIEALRYIRGILLSTELVIIDNDSYIINPLATTIVNDLLTNSTMISTPSKDSEFESYWNTMKYGFFDIVSSKNKDIYSSFFPNLLKQL